MGHIHSLLEVYCHYKLLKEMNACGENQVKRTALVIKNPLYIGMVQASIHTAASVRESIFP
jgi:hypothetical protein